MSACLWQDATVEPGACMFSGNVPLAHEPSSSAIYACTLLLKCHHSAELPMQPKQQPGRHWQLDRPKACRTTHGTCHQMLSHDACMLRDSYLLPHYVADLMKIVMAMPLFVS